MQTPLNRDFTFEVEENGQIYRKTIQATSKFAAKRKIQRIINSNDIALLLTDDEAKA